jgi:fucose 4-O-acetylase-like acetyltransferase
MTTLNTPASKRKNWIDWMKSVGMLVIIWGHAFPTGLTSFIYSFNVPLFFIISGYLFKKENSAAAFFKKNLYTLVIPYLLLCLIKDFSHITKYWNNFGELINCPIGILTGFHTFNDAPAAKNLWFVYTLFILKIIFQFVGKKNRNMILLLLASLGGAYFMNLYGYNLAWAVTDTFAALPFFMFGYILSDRYSACLDNFISSIKAKNIFLPLLGFLLPMLLLLFVSEYNGEVRMFKGFYGNSLLLFLVLGLLGSIAVFFLSVALDNVRFKFIPIISIGTMVILEFHRDLYHPFGKIVKEYSTGVADEGLLSLLFSAIVLLLFIPIVMILQRFFPLILGKRKI